jgi:carnitine 3-dehydrogenase
MKGILDHAGSAIEQWWTPMTQPKLTAEVKAQLVQAAQEVSGGASVSDWVQWRDDNLVSVLKLQHASESAEPGRAKKD